MRARIWLAGSLTGLGTSLTFNLVHERLTTDLEFDLWEFGIALVIPFLVAAIVTKVTRLRTVILLTTAYLTLLIPVLGVYIGASGSEPLWQFAVLGLAGGLL